MESDHLSLVASRKFTPAQSLPRQRHEALQLVIHDLYALGILTPCSCGHRLHELGVGHHVYVSSCARIASTKCSRINGLISSWHITQSSSATSRASSSRCARRASATRYFALLQGQSSGGAPSASSVTWKARNSPARSSARADATRAVKAARMSGEKAPPALETYPSRAARSFARARSPSGVRSGMTSSECLREPRQAPRQVKHRAPHVAQEREGGELASQRHRGHSRTRRSSGHSDGSAPARWRSRFHSGCCVPSTSRPYSAPWTIGRAPTCFTKHGTPAAQHCAIAKRIHARSQGRACGPD